MSEFEILRMAAEAVLGLGALYLIFRPHAPETLPSPPSDEPPPAASVSTVVPLPRRTEVAVAVASPAAAMSYAERQLVMLGHAMRYGSESQVERFRQRVVHELGMPAPETPEDCDRAIAEVRAAHG